MRKSLTRIRVKFIWHSDKPYLFRARVSTHGFERIEEKKASDAETVVALVKRLAGILESVSLASVPFPETRNDYFFYFVETKELLITTFLPIKEKPGQIDVPVFDMVMESYLRLKPDEVRPIRTFSTREWGDRQTCIAILPDGSIQVGKKRPYFT